MFLWSIIKPVFIFAYYVFLIVLLLALIKFLLLGQIDKALSKSDSNSSKKGFLSFLKFAFDLDTYKSRSIMTDNEQEFFLRLSVALPDFYIFPQVSFSAFLEPANYSSESKKMSIRGTYSQKYADYVVTNKAFEVIAIVELDDRTHNEQKDRARDKMLNQAGSRVIRWQSNNKPSSEIIAQRFALLQTAKNVELSIPTQSEPSISRL